VSRITNALGDLRVEAVRFERALGERPLDLPKQVLVLELPRRRFNRTVSGGRNPALKSLVVRARDLGTQARSGPWVSRIACAHNQTLQSRVATP